MTGSKRKQPGAFSEFGELNPRLTPHSFLAESGVSSSNKKTKSADAPKPIINTTTAPTRDSYAPVAPSAPTASTMPKKTATASQAKAPEKFSPQRLPTLLTGKFDLYDAELPFLVSEYLPKGAKSPNFKAVYEKILFYQAKPDFTIRCALREDANGAGLSVGRVACRGVIRNPFDDAELKPIYIVDGQTKDSVHFPACESVHPSMFGAGMGYEAKLELDVGSREGFGCGMIKSGRGVIKMRKVWADEDSGEKELFEGYFAFKVVYGSSLRSMGFGSNELYKLKFWAVRALKKDGKEVGIDPGKGTYVSSYGGSSDSYEGLGIHGYDSDLGLDDDDDEEDCGYDEDDIGFF